MRSDSTFDEELENIGPIPGVLLSELEASQEPFPSDRVQAFDVIATADCGIPAVPDLMLRDEEPIGQCIDGFDGRISEVDLGRIESKTSLLPSELVLDVLKVDVEAAMRTVAASGPLVRQRIADVTAQFGTDAFGIYLPWHKNALNRNRPWGMYLFLEPLLWWAADLYQAAQGVGLALPASKAFDLAFYITYRHEQFHFHVERFCIRQEVLIRQPIYLPYDRHVYSDPSIIGTEHWLEEALAQAVVLESAFLFRRLGLSKRHLKPFMTDQFRSFGPGYKDFDCPAYDGTREAHMVLAAQVVKATPRPLFMATDAMTPKHEYRIAPKAVPGHIAFMPWFISQFQLGMPKHQQFRRWAARNGFRHAGPGPGDHEIWERDRQRVHINCRGKELDIASVKAAAKIRGVTLRRLVEEIRES